MNSATFKTLREACGLNTHDLAKLAISPKTGQSVGIRTVRYWESGNFHVPQDVVDMVVALDNKLTDDANAFIAGNCQTTESLIRYREDADLWAAVPKFKGLPVTCHAALINRIRLKLNELSVEYTINWNDQS